MKSSGRKPGRKKSATAILKNPLNDIALEKFETILDHEHRDLIIFQLREEIMTNVMDKCYEAYLDKQTVLFNGYCAYLAWRHLFQWAFFPRDPGEGNHQNNQSWLPDKPPAPSPRDTWAGYTTPIIVKPEKENKFSSVTEQDFKDPCEMYRNTPKNNQAVSEVVVLTSNKPNGDQNMIESEDEATKDVMPEKMETTGKKVKPPEKKKLEIREKKKQTTKRLQDKKMPSEAVLQGESSTFTTMTTLQYEKLPPPPPPEGFRSMDWYSGSVAQTIKLVDATVELPRKIPIDTIGRLRVPASFEILDENDPCYDRDQKEKRSKKIISRELEHVSKKYCPSEKPSKSGTPNETMSS